MEDLHIIQHPDQKDSPFIFASEKRKLLKIHKWYSFDETTWNRLTEWIREYEKRNEALLTYEGYVDLPDSWEYKYFSKLSYPIYSKNISKYLISNLFGNVLKEFNFYSKGGNYPTRPTFVGSINDDYLKISGECCSSYTSEIYTPFFNWIEIYLNTNPKKIRVEFWMEYFITMSSRRLLDVMKCIENYKNNSSSKVELFWYIHEDDIDIIESGESFKEEVPSLEIVILDKEQRKRMNK